jgi:hypothetical protein
LYGRQKNDNGTVFLGDGSLAAAPTPMLHQRGIRSVIKVVDDRCLYAPIHIANIKTEAD